MKKNIIKISIFFVLSVVFTFSLLNYKTDVNAAEATISVSISSSEIKIGDEFTVTVTCNSNASMAFLQWNFTYPTSKLKHIPLEDQSESSGVINAMLDFSQGDVAKTVSVKYKFKAIAVGLVEFNVKDVENYRLETGDSDVIETEVKSASVTITEKNKSKDANLTSISGFKGDKTFSTTPAFDKNVTDYKITVPSDYELLYIEFGKSDPDAKASISGNEFLNYGDNKRVITVVAPDGTTKKYNVNIVREQPKATEAPTNTPKPTDVPTEIPTEVPSETPPVESATPDITETPTAPVTDIPNVDEDGDVIIGNVTTEVRNVTVYDIDVFFKNFGGNDDVTVKEFKIGEVTYKGIPINSSENNTVYIVYAKVDNGMKDLYCYDSFDGSFQRCYLSLDNLSGNATEMPEDQTTTAPSITDKPAKKDDFISNAVVVGLCAAGAILAIIAVVFVVSKTGKSEEDFD